MTVKSKDEPKMCKRCGINPVPKGRWAYCSEQCLGVRSFNRPEEKLGTKTRICRKCGETFIVERAGQMHCVPHMIRRSKTHTIATLVSGVCQHEGCTNTFTTNKPNQKYCSEHRAKAWQPRNALSLEPMSKVDRQAIINQVLRQYGRKPKEWSS